MKLREFLVCFALLFGAALSTTGCALVVDRITPHDGAAPAATKPPSATSPITVWVDDETPCDVLPSQRLDVAGIDQPRCDDQGGRWIGDGIDICQDVDK